MNIILKHISKSFDVRKKSNTSIDVLKAINCSFESGKIYFIHGASGSGKSTLLSIIGLLDKPSEGEILFDGKAVEDSQKFIDEHISFVFQEYNLFENLTVYENFRLYLSDEKELEELLSKFNLKISTKTKVKYLSGGERQRLSILRSYVKGGDIFLLDEPTGNLDSSNSKAVMDLVKSVNKDRVIIVVSHDLEIASGYADVIFEIKDGRLSKPNENIRSLTLNFKSEGKKALTPLIMRVITNKNLSLIIGGTIYELNLDNYLSILDKLYDEHKNECVEIDIYREKSETKHIDLPKKENNQAAFYTNYSRRNIMSKVGRTLGSMITLVFAFTLLFAMFNFIFYDVGVYINNNFNELNIFLSYGVLQENERNYYEGAILHDLLSEDKNYYAEVAEIQVQNASIIQYDMKVLITQKDEIVYDGINYQIPENELLIFNNVSNLCGSEINIPSLLSDDFFTLTIAKETIKANNTRLDYERPTIFSFLSSDYYFSLYGSDLSQYIFDCETPQKIGDKSLTVPNGQRFKMYSNEELKAGDNISSSNEIIVSQRFIDYYLLDEEDVIGKTFNIAPLSSFDFMTRNEAIFDLNKIWNEVTIVGITKETTNVDIFVDEMVVNALLRQTIQSGKVLFSTENCASKINYLYDNNVIASTDYIDINPAVEIYAFAKHYKGQMIYVFLAIAIILLLISAVILLLWILNVVKDRYREIAIMKCLGASNKGIHLSFLTMVLFVALISSLFGMIFGAALTPVLNIFVTSTITAKPSCTLLYSWNLYSFFLPSFFLIIFSVISSLFFTRRINKIEPYAALKEFR